MDIQTVSQIISTIGFPIFGCGALGWFCYFMINKNNENINRMFDMYDKANSENRQAINDCTKAIERLCDKLDLLK